MNTFQGELPEDVPVSGPYFEVVALWLVVGVNFFGLEDDRITGEEEIRLDNRGEFRSLILAFFPIERVIRKNDLAVNLNG